MGIFIYFGDNVKAARLESNSNGLCGNGESEEHLECYFLYLSVLSIFYTPSKYALDYIL
jgi:hypothetical protein